MDVGEVWGGGCAGVSGIQEAFKSILLVVGVHIARILWLVIWTRQNLSCFDFTVFPIVIVQPFGLNNTPDGKFQVCIFMKIA